MVGGLGKIGNQSFMFIGQQKGYNTKTRQYRNFGMSNPEGYRKALRLMKMAEKFGIPERGLIRENYFADVVALDPNKIQDLATPENPYQYSMGINEVIVNGEAVLENGKYNGKRNGQVIRKENRGWF